MSDIVIICAKCNTSLYTVKRVKFPIDYRTFVPLHGVDNVYPEDPICIFCERPFQIVPNDFKWSTIVNMPLKTNRGIISPENRVAEEEAKELTGVARVSEETEGPACACGCGQPVKREGRFVSAAHKIKMMQKMGREGIRA